MDNNFISIIDKINSYNDIVLLVHESPDGDAIGSIISLFRALLKLDKNVDGFIEKKPSNCLFLLDTIGKEIKTFDEIDFNRKYDLCIAMDCGDLNRLGGAKELFYNAKDTICIDHHVTNTGFANANYIDPDAAATGEIIYKLLREMNIQLDSDIATSIYAAISSDTGNFCHNNTTKSTFKIAAELLGYGVNIADISFHLFYESSFSRTLLLGRLLQGIELFLDGKLAIITVQQKDLEELSISTNELDGFVDYARYIQGVEVGAIIKPYDGIYKISMRSNGKIDVANIAQKFDGGGHKFAAGCKIAASSGDEAKNKLVNAFLNAIN